MPLDQFFGGPATHSANGSYLGNLNSVASYAECLPGLDRVHDRR